MVQAIIRSMAILFLSYEVINIRGVVEMEFHCEALVHFLRQQLTHYGI